MRGHPRRFLRSDTKQRKNMTQTIGIMGAGMIGGQVARLAVAAGVNVIVSNSRSPKTLGGLIQELGPRARAATPDEAARESDLVLAAIPFYAYPKLPPDTVAGKVVIDTMNYYPERDGQMPEVQTDMIASSELVQRHLHNARLVKALNNMDWIRLLNRARPAGDPDRSALPVASNDKEAQYQVTKFLHSIGYDAVDMGGLADSWRSEPTMPAYVMPYIGTAPADLTRETAKNWFLTAPGVRVPPAQLKRLLDKAIRHDRMFGSMASMPGASA
jgi:predicted dinucleotide-binding enzyme